LLLALVVNSTALASVINVPAAQPTIQAGINVANNGDTVLVAPGTYTENINFMGKAITVKSSKGASVTIIDGGGVAPVVTFNMNETSSSTLSGFTLQHGISTVSSLYRGAGVYVYFASPTIKNNVIQNNIGSTGAGIGVYYGSPLIRRNTIKSNSMPEGYGAISVDGPGSTQIIGNVTIVGSSSSPQGSAVYITGYDDQAQFFNNLMIGPSGTNAVFCDSSYDQTPPIFTNNDAYSANGTGLQGTCSGESSMGGNISTDPLFVNTYHLRGGSPAIDVGNNSASDLPATDLAGNQRIINGNDGPTAIVDLGTYELVPVTVSTKSLSFGLQSVGSSTTKTVKLTNAQNKVLNISSYSVPTSYTVTGCGSTLAAFSTSCSLTVTFQPLTSGTFNGTLTITDDAGNSPQMVSLSGSAH